MNASKSLLAVPSAFGLILGGVAVAPPGSSGPSGCVKSAGSQYCIVCSDCSVVLGPDGEVETVCGKVEGRADCSGDTYAFCEVSTDGNGNAEYTATCLPNPS